MFFAECQRKSKEVAKFETGWKLAKTQVNIRNGHFFEQTRRFRPLPDAVNGLYFFITRLPEIEKGGVALQVSSKLRLAETRGKCPVDIFSDANSTFPDHRI